VALKAHLNYLTFSDMQKYRSPKEFSDTHSLIMHTYNYSDSADLLVDHLGLHKALCVLFGWNHLMPPDNSRVYQSLSAEEAAANQDDLIMWPPLVIIHNTITGKGRDGRMDGLGNKAMDSKLRGIKVPLHFSFPLSVKSLWDVWQSSLRSYAFFYVICCHLVFHILVWPIMILSTLGPSPYGFAFVPRASY